MSVPLIDVTDRQRLRWLLHRSSIDRGITNVASAATVDRDLDPQRMTAALEALVIAHPHLRTTLAPAPDGGAHGAVDADAADLRLDPAPTTVRAETVVHGGDRDTEELLSDACTRPFLPGAVGVRVVLAHAAPGSTVCLVTHLGAAGPDTADALLAELLRGYGDGVARTTPATAGPACRGDRPPDVAAVRYWTDLLAGVDPEELAMATARPLPDLPTFAGGVLRCDLGTAGRGALDDLTRRHGTEAVAVLMTVYAMLLAQHGAGPHLVVGVPAGSILADPPGGTPAHLLPIPIRLGGGDTFTGLLDRVARAVRDAAKHPGATVEDLPPAGTARWWAPWVRHTLHVAQGSPVHRLSVDGSPASAAPTPARACPHDLQLNADLSGATLALTARFSIESHTAAEIAAFVDRYVHLLCSVQSTTAAATPLLTPRDYAVIATANATGRTFPTVSVADLVATQARRTPAAPAVDDTSYRDLVRLAAAVRALLVDAGVDIGDVVAVTGPRGAGLAAAMLGVWQAGAAYLPLATGAAAELTGRNLRAAQARVVVRADEGTVAVNGHRVGLDAIGEVRAGRRADTDAPGSADGAPARGRAYVIFTSGSTGRPKGVAVSHTALTNLVADMTARLPVRPTDRMLWSTAITFDVSALELWAPLTVGAHVCTVDDTLLLTPGDLLAFVADNDITLLQGTPTLWQHVASALHDRGLSGRRVLVGGEPVPAVLVDRLLAGGAQVRNMYGPTETTIWSTTAALAEPVPRPVPIGTPIANTQVYVVNADGDPVFPGVSGELLIAGAGVADGYLNDAALTDARFILDPEWGRCYRTGDRVRQQADGSLEFLGRADRQVKVLGHRIELAAVEAVLGTHPHVSAAAVVAEAAPDGRTRLAAAVTLTRSAADTIAGLRRRAAEHLPRAAVPARIVVVDALPVTPNGKTDYAAVTGMVTSETPADLADGSNPHLDMLVELWQAALDDPNVTATANFFAHGGRLRQALTLAAAVRRATGRGIPGDAVLAAPSPQAMHRLLATTGR